MAIEAAALKGVQVNFIVQEEPEAVSLVNAISGWDQKKLPISLMRAVGIPGIADVTSNFATMDGQAYRFETDRNEVSAHACMFNPRIAAQLEDVFFRFKAALV